MIHAFISGLPESLAGGQLLPVAFVGTWVTLAVILDRRHRHRNQVQPAAPFVEPSPADRRHNIIQAAGRINLDLGSMWLPPSPGDGRNKNLIPGREGIVGYIDYDRDFHSPRDIDRRRVSPRGVPQVPLIEERHENVVLVVVDANLLDLAGSPNDETDKLTAIKEVALTLFENARLRNYTIGLLATRSRQPIYLRPGSSTDEMIKAIQRLQPGERPDQSQDLKNLAIDNSQRVKATIIVSNFKQAVSQELVRQLPGESLKVAVQVTGEWDCQFGGLTDQVNIECADNRIRRFNPRKMTQRYNQLSQNRQAKIEQQVKRGDIVHCRVDTDQPDVPGQLARVLGQFARD